MQITKPGTQRKRLFQAPKHRRHKEFSASLSSDLKGQHGVNAFPVKTGDTVRVTRGDRAGFEGKITSVNRNKYRIFVEGVTREKVDGTAIPIPIHPSKVMIINLNMDDKRRRERLKQKGSAPQRKRVPRKKTSASIKPAVEKAEETKELLEKKKPITKSRKKKKPAKPPTMDAKKRRTKNSPKTDQSKKRKKGAK
jgi:large subunit ribosomal protein L24